MSQTTTPFADKDTCSMIIEMDRLYFYNKYYYYKKDYGILHQTIEEWLWEKYKIIVETEHSHGFRFFVYMIQLERFCSLGLDDDDVQFEGPITARIEGIKAAVKYKWEQQFKKEGK